MSLSSWLRDYVYIPLGGSQRGSRLRNLMATMLLGGLWHGAAWLFVLWGAWHGMLLAVFHGLKKGRLIPSNEKRIGYWFNRQITFLCVIVGWVFFRAADVRLGDYGATSIMPALRMLSEMAGIHGLTPSPGVALVSGKLWSLLAACWLWCNYAPNSFEVVYSVRLRRRYAILAGATTALCVLEFGAPIDFLYFRF